MADTAASLAELSPMELYPYAIYCEKWGNGGKIKYKRYAKLQHMNNAYTSLRNQGYYRDCEIKKFQFNFETSEWENYNEG